MHLKKTTAAFITKNDPGFTEDVLSHNEFGVRVGCWSADGKKK